MAHRFLRRAWFCAAIIGVLAGSSADGAAQRAAPSALPRASSVVVFPFENIGHAGQLDWLGEGLSELTIERLGGHGLSVFSREERLDALEKLGLPAYARFSRATMLKIAAEIDADYIIFGEFSAESGVLRVTARVLRVTPPALAEPIAESGALDSLSQIQARFAWQALCEIQNSLSQNSPCRAASSTQQQFVEAARPLRPDAFELYIRGLLSADDDTRLRNLHEAARLQPDWDEPPLALARTYYAKRDCEAALQWFGRISTQGPHAAEANFDSGVCDLLRNDPVHAESAFSAITGGAQTANGGDSAVATDSGPDQPEVASNLGAALLRQARYKEAVADFERALRLDPGEPDYEFNEGLGQYLAGDWAAASKALREALRFQPDDVQVKALLIAALDRAGESGEANALRAKGPASASEAAQDPAPAPPRRDVTKLDPTALARLARIRTTFGQGAAR
jgi:tetratricopeptide (TPR) repeat protein